MSSGKKESSSPPEKGGETSLTPGKTNTAQTLLDSESIYAPPTAELLPLQHYLFYQPSLLCYTPTITHFWLRKHCK